MRIVLLLLFISTGITATAQDNLSRQLQLIIKDTTTHFQKIKGPLKSFIMDSVFHSTLTIEGTKSNELDYSPYKAYYTAFIIDSTTTETAGKLFDQWMSKLTKALGPLFRKKEGRPAEGFQSFHVKSYQFEYGGLYITLNHSLTIFDSRLHQVRLYFSYTFPPSQKGFFD